MKTCIAKSALKIIWRIMKIVFVARFMLVKKCINWFSKCLIDIVLLVWMSTMDVKKKYNMINWKNTARNVVLKKSNAKMSFAKRKCSDTSSKSIRKNATSNKYLADFVKMYFCNAIYRNIMITAKKSLCYVRVARKLCFSLNLSNMKKFVWWLK